MDYTCGLWSNLTAGPCNIPRTAQSQQDDVSSVTSWVSLSSNLRFINIFYHHVSVCLKGTKIHGKCFLADPLKKRYHAASEDCIAKGGTLSTPFSLDENDKLYDYMRQSIGPDEEIWLGINDMQTEGVWVDQTGSPTRYKNWDSSFKGDRTMNCAVLSGSISGKWLDENCKEERASVCEFNIVWSF